MIKLTTIPALALVGLLLAAPASAATADDGRWYLDDFNIATHHANGFTGEGVTIAVLDGPVNTDVPTLKDANIEVHEPSYCYTEDGEAAPAISADLSGADSAYHGTNVVSYIAGTGDGYPGQTGVQGVAPGAKVLYYAISRLDSVVDGGEVLTCLEEDGQDVSSGEVDAAMNDAIDAGADIITVSAGYTASAYGPAYFRAIREGVIVVGSVANTDDLEISLHFPAGANGAVGVQAGSRDQQIQTTDGRPNDDISTMLVGPGIGIVSQGTRDGSWEDQPLTSGTSIATPIVAGFIALAMQKWPEATGNQTLQNLVRSGYDEGVVYQDPERLVGFGFATATRMLERDSSQFDDVNPLLDVRPVNIPDTAELLAPAAETPEPTPSADTDPEAGSGIETGALIALAVGGILLLAVVAFIIVVVVRRSRTRPPTGNKD